MCMLPQVPLEELLLEPDREKPPDVAITWCSGVPIPAAPIILAISVIIVLMMFLILHPGRSKPPGTNNMCSTPDCHQHAGLLGVRSINWSCGDFGSFVCAGWRSKPLDISWTVSSQVALNWMSGVVSMSYRSYDRNSIVYTPLAMIRKCMDGTDDDRAMTSLIALVNASGLAWPTRGDSGKQYVVKDYSRPLRLVVELSVLWALPLWFRVQMIPARARWQRERVFVVTPSLAAPLWYTFHKELSHYEDDYIGYLNLFYSTVLRFRHPSESFTNFLSTSAMVQTWVFEQLNFAFSADHSQPRLLEIRSLPSFVKNLTAGDWVTTLGQIYGPRYSITDDDIFLFTNEKLLAAASSIFTSYSAQDVFFHTLWWFIQSVGSLTSHSIHSFMKAHPKRMSFMVVMCFDHVAATHNGLLAAINKASFEHSEQLFIADHLENIRNVTLEKLHSYKLSARTREALISVLENMTTVIWPEEDFGRPGGFEEYYGKPYEGGESFFEEWKLSRVRLQRLYTEGIIGDYVKAALVHEFDGDRVVAYNPALNVLSVSPSALTPPLYYRQATTAVIYGGLGYVYARAIFEALDTISHLLNGGSSMQPTDQPETTDFWNASWCGYPAGGRSMFPHLPALDVAYSAYSRSRNETSDLPLERLPQYSPKQVFFLTFCHSNCYLNTAGVKLSPACNSAMAHFDNFTRAFMCPDADIEHKCSFN
ncbi:hypothetical protein V5799_003980 [Amblyomma americanum]|uniref:M13 family peptidase n=1 Tax=Amblyomma americanum TaxID=6943 RepID=A0AAQ4D7E6_AMBAM